MHPILFEFNTPESLSSFLPDTITIYSYGTMIALGALLGFFYLAYQSKKQLDIRYEISNELVLIILISAIIGGKLFLIFEDPSRYLSEPKKLFENFSQGFVFYGSLLTAIPAMLIFFRIKKIAILPMLDIIAVTTLIVHGTGRIGCFLAGCCYGIPNESFLAIVFTDPVCQARPLNVPLHPTQLYSVILISGILITLLIVKTKKQFHGQLFTLYLILYPFGRIVIEFFRGDLSRGFVIGETVSTSQFISILVIIGGIYFYRKMKKKNNIRI